MKSGKLNRDVRLFRVAGRVQGVGFRMFVQRVANELGVDGWVRNCRDGAVEVHAECTSTKMARLRDALREGPAASRVTELTEQPATPLGRRGFTIK